MKELSTGQSANITLKHTRDIKKYRPVLEGLVDDFGYVYWDAILEWCGIVHPGNISEFWRVWLIEHNRQVVGMCGLYSILPGTEELWLGWFGIIPAHRNAGLGAKVLAKIETEAVKNGCRVLRTYVDVEGRPIPFYERAGFVRVSTVGEYCRKSGVDMTMEYFEGEDDHVLEKILG